VEPASFAETVSTARVWAEVAPGKPLGFAFLPAEVVLILLVLFGAALIAGLLATAATRRWPVVEPSRAVGVAAREVATQPAARHPFLRARIDPGAATGLGLTLALLGIVVGGTVLGVLAFLVRITDTGLLGLDHGAATWGAEHTTSLSVFALKVVTQLGATVTITVLAIALCVLEYRRLPSRSMPAYLLLVVLGQLLIANLIKVAVARARPDIDPLAAFTGASFPSGHTTAAASCYAAMAMLLGRGRPLRARSILAGVAVGIAVAVATSRVLLGVHWFSDVLAGLALGWSWFAICSIAFGGHLMRFGAPVEAAQVPRDDPAPRPPVSPVPSRGYRRPEERGGRRRARPPTEEVSR
jgi:membrane-associated phospholipid phosphatase